VRVSFIVPLFNCLALTQAMLRSLAANLPAAMDYEIVFVDDGSTDGTREWLKTLTSPQIRVLLNETNCGYAIANNRGAATARGEYVLLLNNDVVLTRDWLGPILAGFSLVPRAGLVGNVQVNARTGELDHAGIFINGKGKPEHDRRAPEWLKSYRISPAATGACLCLPRALWKRLGGFDGGFLNGGEDVDLCFRARRDNLQTVVALKSIIRHHVSSSPGRKRRDEANTERLTRRWRPLLAELGARAWCEDYLARRLSAATAFSQPGASALITLHALGMIAEPPAVARQGINDAIDREISRWGQLLS
jgi:O-antigen biosynthesis protein